MPTQLHGIDFQIGNVKVTFRQPKGSTIQEYNKARRPRLSENEITFPNDGKIRIKHFNNTNECFIVIGDGQIYGSGYCCWCGEKNGKAFAYEFSKPAGKFADESDREKFKLHIKPSRIQMLESPNNPATLMATMWSVKLQLASSAEFWMIAKLCFPRMQFLETDKPILHHNYTFTGKIWKPTHAYGWMVVENLKTINPNGQVVYSSGLDILQHSRFVTRFVE